MKEITFAALGTHWSISLDTTEMHNYAFLEKQIITLTSNFEKRFSRFIDTSEVNQFRHAKSGTYSISPELFKLLSWCQELKELTHGKFDPTVATLLETLGYDQNYSLVSKDTASWSAVSWKLENNKIHIDGPIVFDLGGVGKGYWIDQLSDFLKQQKVNYFLVEGGGDMYGTTKSNGSPWNIAIEYPNRPGYALGQIPLINSAFAGSDIYKRSWANVHHLLDAQTKAPLSSYVACFTTAPAALIADSLTKVLMLTSPEIHLKLANKYYLDYLLLTPNFTIEKSPTWPGEIFT